MVSRKELSDLTEQVNAVLKNIDKRLTELEEKQKALETPKTTTRKTTPKA